MAFLLRHIPLLQTIDGAGGNLAEGVLLIQNASSLDEIQEEFYHQLFHQAASRLDRRFYRADHPVSSLIPLPLSCNLFIF